MKNKFLVGGLLLFAACSPLKSSPHDEKHQLELTLHEVQTNLDDLRHDMHCFKADLEILDGRIRGFENTISNLKKEDLEKHSLRLEQLNALVLQLEKRLATQEHADAVSKGQLQQLTNYAQETSSALTQYKTRIHEIEKEISSEQKKVEELAKKSVPIKIYRVKPGDSLQKIAKLHKTTIEKIKQLNTLDQDLIVVGQELQIPCE